MFPSTAERTIDGALLLAEGVAVKGGSAFPMGWTRNYLRAESTPFRFSCQQQTPKFLPNFQFVEMGYEDRARLHRLLKRLLR